MHHLLPGPCLLTQTQPSFLKPDASPPPAQSPRPLPWGGTGRNVPHLSARPGCQCRLSRLSERTCESTESVHRTLAGRGLAPGCSYPQRCTLREAGALEAGDLTWSARLCFLPAPALLRLPGRHICSLTLWSQAGLRLKEKEHKQNKTPSNFTKLEKAARFKGLGPLWECLLTSDCLPVSISQCIRGAAAKCQDCAGHVSYRGERDRCGFFSHGASPLEEKADTEE